MTDYGIDVSHWNAIADAHAVRAGGVTFAWCKATEGTSYVDPTFVAKVAQLRAAGLVVGAYHFMHGANVAGQVAHFTRHARAAGCLDRGALVPMLDMEANTARPNANQIVREFYDGLGTHFAEVYGNLDWWKNVLRPSEWGDRNILWHIARYNGNPGDPGVPGGWAVHQHTSQGRVPGIPGNVDRNATMNGYTLSELTFGQVVPPRPAPVPPPSPAGPPADTWVVRHGDTLSRVASAWGVTVSALAAANGIPNPDLIYPNQVIHRPGTLGSAPAPVPGPWYTIQPGDTLSEIAARYGITVAQLVTINKISNPDRIYAGAQLQLPAAPTEPAPATPGPIERVYVVQRGDTLGRIAAQLGYPGGYPALAARNHITNPNLVYPGQRIYY